MSTMSTTAPQALVDKILTNTLVTNTLETNAPVMVCATGRCIGYGIHVVVTLSYYYSLLTYAYIVTITLETYL